MQAERLVLFLLPYLQTELLRLCSKTIDFLSPGITHWSIRLKKNTALIYSSSINIRPDFSQKHSEFLWYVAWKNLVHEVASLPPSFFTLNLDNQVYTIFTIASNKLNFILNSIKLTC